MDNLKEEISNVNFNGDTTDKSAEQVDDAPFFEKTSGLTETVCPPCDDFSTTIPPLFTSTCAESAENGSDVGVENGIDKDVAAYNVTDNACSSFKDDKSVKNYNKVNVNQDLQQDSDGNFGNFPSNPIASKTRYVERNKRSTNALILSLAGLLLSVVVFIGIIPSIMGFAKSLKLYTVEKTQTEKWGVWVGFAAIMANLFMIVTFILFLSL